MEREQGTKELAVDAIREKVPEVIAFVEAELAAAGCPAEVQTDIDIAVEELFVNIASYAYPDGPGTAVIRMRTAGGAARITLIDSGKAFNPLAKPDPDLTLPAKKRKIGGLGIYIVKQSMDDIHYEYTDGKNVLTIRKQFLQP